MHKIQECIKYKPGTLQTSSHQTTNVSENRQHQRNSQTRMGVGVKLIKTKKSLCCSYLSPQKGGREKVYFSKRKYLSSQRGGRIACPQMFPQQNFHNLENMKPSDLIFWLQDIDKAPIVVRMVREKKQDWMQSQLKEKSLETKSTPAPTASLHT